MDTNLRSYATSRQEVAGQASTSNALEGFANQLIDLRRASELIADRLERFLQRTQGPVPSTVQGSDIGVKEQEPMGSLANIQRLLNGIHMASELSLKLLNDVEKVG